MKHLWWLIPFATALVDSIVLVALVTGFAGLVYLAMRSRAPMPPVRGEQEPDKRDVERDIPPSPG
jgi:hypothetical protein